MLPQPSPGERRPFQSRTLVLPASLEPGSAEDVSDNGAFRLQMEAVEDPRSPIIPADVLIS